MFKKLKSVIVQTFRDFSIYLFRMTHNLEFILLNDENNSKNNSKNNDKNKGD